MENTKCESKNDLVAAANAAASQNQPVTLADVQSCKDGVELNELMERAADLEGYHSRLEVPFSYWHYGRHAEFAKECGLAGLSDLFSAAWKRSLEI